MLVTGTSYDDSKKVPHYHAPNLKYNKRGKVILKLENLNSEHLWKNSSKSNERSMLLER